MGTFKEAQDKVGQLQGALAKAPTQPFFQTLIDKAVLFTTKLQEVLEPFPQFLYEEPENPWWRNYETIPGEYQLQEGEDIEDIARRMGIPLDELEWEWVNEGERIVSIPIPGWIRDEEYELPGVVAPLTHHFSQRTLIDGEEFEEYGGVYFDDEVESLQEWWNSLSVAEQHVEMALTATTGHTPFQHIHEYSFDWVMNLIEEEYKSEILAYSEQAGVMPELVAGILASELLYDYGQFNDFYADLLVPDVIADLAAETPLDPARGYANIHTSARKAAHEYLRQAHLEFYNYEWGSGYVMDWGPFRNEEGELSRYRTPPELAQTYHGDWGNPEDAEGAIVGTTLVARWLVDLYVSNPLVVPTGAADVYRQHPDFDPNYTVGAPFSPAPENLSAADMATIFGAYRAGRFHDWEAQGLGWQAQTAFPIMEYMFEIFSEDDVTQSGQNKRRSAEYTWDGKGDSAGEQQPSLDMSELSTLASDVVGALAGIEEIAPKINAAAQEIIKVINGATIRAAGMIENKKTAAIEAIKATKPAPTNSAQEESENTPIVKGEPI